MRSVNRATAATYALSQPRDGGNPCASISRATAATHALIQARTARKERAWPRTAAWTVAYAAPKQAPCASRQPNRTRALYVPSAIKGAITSAITLINFTRILSEGPAVSLNGSPTVSPTTAALCASEPFL